MNSRARQLGFTLIELLVAMAIGLLITLVVTKAYISGIGTQQAQTNISRAQEASRFAVDILAQGLRQAGYMNPASTTTPFCNPSTVKLTHPNRLFALNGDQHTTIGPGATDLSGATALQNNSDTLRVKYYGDSNGGAIFDCQGNVIANGTTLIVDTYYVSADANNGGEPTLYCHSSNTGTSAALVPGVESLQMLFGEDVAPLDGVIDRYVDAEQVADFDNVSSVMISLVTRTQERSATDHTGRDFNLFGKAYAPNGAAPAGDAGSVLLAAVTGDGRMRQMTSTTVALRNLFCP